MEKKFVINVGRQLGSGGYEIGKRLAERFGIAFYDKELLSISSEESGLSAEFFERADERAAQGIFGGLLGLRFPFVGEGAIPQTNCLSNDALFKVQSDVIRRLADEKSCLFMGRCADYILRDHPRCANIFISSTRQDRIARLRRLYGIGETEADDMIEKGDDKRADYYNYYTYKNWGAAESYHLCIDSSVLGIDGTVDFVASFIRKKLGL